jgi:hypothetical protein
MLSNHHDTDEYDEDEDDYLDKVPARFQQVVRKPNQEQILRPWIVGWD